MRAVEPVEQGEVRSHDGVGIAWERFGPDGAPWVLFVPTWNIVDARSWKFAVPHLARRFRVLTFDPRGNGRSERPAAGYAITDHMADALAVLDRHEVASAAVVSASQGANQAILLALEHPDRVERLVLHGQAVGQGITPEIAEQVVKRDYSGFCAAFFGACFNEPHSTKPVEDTMAWSADTTADVLAAGAADFDRDLIAPRLGDVGCPVLLVHGAEEQIVPIDKARAVAAAIPGAELVVVEGGGHRPDLRDPVLVNRVVDDFLGPGAAHRPVRTVARGAARTGRRVLFASSPIGLGHVRRGLAVAAGLRERCPDVEIEWLVQDPAASVLAQAGERLHPRCAELAAEIAHVEAHASGHRLPIFRAWRDLDAVLIANAMVFLDAVRETRYDLWIGDEAWEVDQLLHDNPDLKTAPFAFLTDFVGWLPMDDDEAPLTADHNAEMIEQVERYPRVRDAALFLGEPDDLTERPFGPGLPSIAAWARDHFAFPGYVLPDGLPEAGGAPDPAGPPQIVAAVGGTSTGGPLLERVLAAFALLRADVPDARLLAVGGPRVQLDPASVPEGATLAGYVDDLPARLAGCDLAVTHGGLGTTMELVAARRPMVWVPLRDHCEQQLHVAHRLRRLGAPPPTAFEHTEPEALAALMLERLRAPVHYGAIDREAATRVAAVLGDLLDGRPRAGGHDHHTTKELQDHAIDPA